jgi:DNA-binding NarL/FixJ family response regulator
MGWPMRVLLADDHQIFREGVKLLLAARSPHQVIAETGDGGALKDLVKEHLPDLLLLDYPMPRCEMTAAIDYLKKRYMRLRIVVLTDARSGVLLGKLHDAGADAILLKQESSQCLLDAIEHVAAGNSFLSPAVFEQMGDVKIKLTMREFQVLRLLCRGLSSIEIAESFCLSDRTIGKHRENLFRKLNVSSAAQLINRAQQLDLL